MLSLPLITPRDSHELWFGPSQPYRSSQNHTNSLSGSEAQIPPRRNGQNGRALTSSASQGNNLSSLLLEERALRARKNNIASFGYSWIKPAGCPKTMLGMKEEEAEREEALAAAAAEMTTAADPSAEGVDEFGGAGQGQVDGEGEGGDETGMERDLDDDVPDADAEGLVEDGEEGLEEEGVVDEEGYMERDLDDDIPEAFPDGDEEQLDSLEEGEDDFDNQPNLDDDIPSAAGGDEDMSDEEEGMGHDLDDDIPEAAEDRHEQEDEWQHTDTDAEFDEEDEASFSNDPFTQSLRTSTTSSRGGLPGPPPMRRERGTDAQRRFLQRWSGGGDAFDSSSMVVDEDDLRASLTSQTSRRSVFSRFPRRRTGWPRDSLDH